MGCEKTLAAVLQLQHDAGLIMSNIQVIGQFRHFVEPDGVGGHADGIRSRAISFGCSAVRHAVSPCSSCGSLYGSHGFVASAEQSRSTGPSAVVVMQRVDAVF